MKRDMLLLRQIILSLEAINNFPVEVPDVCKMVDGEENTVYFHLQMLVEAGFITAVDASWKCCKNMLVQNITNTGYDFIDQIRNETVYRKAVAFIASKGLPVTLELLKDICSKFLLELL